MLRRLFLVFILISTVAVAGCKISGTITTADGEGVDGVTVYLDGEGEDGDGSIMRYHRRRWSLCFSRVSLRHSNDHARKRRHTFNPPLTEMTVEFFQNVLDERF